MDGRDVAPSVNRLNQGGGWRLRRLLVAAVVLLVGWLPPALGWGQAMGRISIDGPSPLPLAPRITEPDRAATQKAPVASDAITAPPAVVPGAPIGEGQPVGNTVARTPAPLPEIKPPEPPSPPASNPALSSGTPAPAPEPLAAPPVPAIAGVTPAVAASTVAAPPAGGTSSGRGDIKPVNDLERQPIRSGTSGTGGKSPAGDNASGAGGSALGGAGQVIAALAIVVGLIFIGRALVRKFVPGAAASNGKGVIEVLARHPLAKNQSLVLLRIGSQIVALNQGRESSASVLVISEPMEVARIIGQIEGKSPASMQAGFNRLLANARMDLESGDDAAEPGSIGGENLDEQLEEMAAAKRQLMELRQHVRTVRDSLPRE
jgi:hypothetical protein